MQVENKELLLGNGNGEKLLVEDVWIVNCVGNGSGEKLLVEDGWRVVWGMGVVRNCWWWMQVESKKQLLGNGSGEKLLVVDAGEEEETVVSGMGMVRNCWWWMQVEKKKQLCGEWEWRETAGGRWGGCLLCFT